MNELFVFAVAYLGISTVAMLVLAWTEPPMALGVEHGGHDTWEDLGEFR